MNLAQVMVGLLLVGIVRVASPAALIYVDAGDTVGTIRNLSGMNAGPASISPGAVEVTEAYRQLEVPSVRIHDFYGAGDIDFHMNDDGMFPDFDADPTLETSYNFGPTDAVIKSVIDSGAQVYFRLGYSYESAEENAEISYDIRPEDFPKWALICKHIVQHYNDGWANGFNYGIKYWEIWNEPNHPLFWKGTAEEYFELYKLTAQTLLDYDSTLKIGGPAMAGLSTRFMEPFLDFVRDEDLPLDFFSWHNYATAWNPEKIRWYDQNVRNALDSRGFMDTEVIVSEWNIGFTPRRLAQQGSAKGAAFTASSLIFMQDTSTAMTHRYRGDASATLDDPNFQLFAADGTFKKPAYVYLALSELYRSTPNRIHAQVIEPPQNSGYAVLAGMSKDRNKVLILLSSYRPVSTDFHLYIVNLPWLNLDTTFEAYLINESSDLELVSEEVLNGPALDIEGNLQAPAVMGFVLEKKE